MKLYELTHNWNQVQDIAEQLDAETLKDTLDSIEEEIESKVENTAKVVKNLEGDIEAVKSEMKRLSDKKSTLENNVKGIKRYLQEEMEKVGKDKIKGTLFSVGIQNNPQSLNVEDESHIPEGFFIEQAPKLDKKQLLKEMKDGLEVPGVEITQSRSLRIR